MASMKTLAMLRTPLLTCGTLLLALGLSGCILLDMDRSGQAQQSHGAVAVQVSGRAEGVTTYALALDGKTIVSAQKVSADGIAAFLLSVGKTFDVAVFSDLNRNRRFDAGEPSGWLPAVQPTALSAASFRGAQISVALQRSESGVPLGLAVPKEEPEAHSSMDIHLGELVKLNDPRFSVANGVSGLWQPYEFLTKLGWGLYFLQPYDSAKIPVVFVYGIGGSPQNWKSMIASLDHTKYQPWFFYYPTGLRLEKCANGLSLALQTLKAHYGFPKLYVIAHSMGGLVARGALEQAVAESGTNFIPKFITLCTPWGGDAEADGGVKHLKYPVPAWIDMEPGSSYLKRIFAQELPVGTRHWLIFDFQTHRAPWLKPDNDGVVQVKSELFPAAQAEAVALFGFNYGHEETLGKSDVHAKVNEYLSLP